jgi:hypothetical protein
VEIKKEERRKKKEEHRVSFQGSIITEQQERNREWQKY